MSRKPIDKIKGDIEDNFNNKDSKPKGNRRNRRGKPKQVSSNAKPNSNYDRKSLENASNNPQLYKRFPELLRWASQIPINVISNLPAPLSDNSLTLPNIVIYTLDLISPCTPNSSDERNTNMVQLSNDMYAKIREYNSGAKNYDPPALTRLIFAMAGVFQRINFLQRIYGLINHTSAYNRAFPQMLFRAMHLDYESFRDDQTNFAGRLDTIIVRAKDIKLISDIPILERIGMMYANYYIDTDDARDTLYIPMPGKRGFLDLDATENLVFSDGGFTRRIGQTFVDSDTDLIDADTLLKDTEQYLNKVLTSQDFGIMQGDIVHAFPNASLTTLNALPESLDLGPINDKAMLLQYHNADIINGDNSYWKTNNNFFLTFDTKGLPVGNYELAANTLNPYNGYAYTVGLSVTGTIPSSVTNNQYFKDYSFMCLDSDTVSEDWFLEATRMKVGAGVDVIESATVYLAFDSKVMNDIVSEYTYTPTSQDINKVYGEFPYTKHLINYNGTFQKSVRLVKIADVTTQATWNTNGCKDTTHFWFETSGTNNAAMILAANEVRAVCRYLPYSVTLIKPFKDAASGNITIKDHGHYHVNTFCPIVQPVPKSTMDMLSFICWKSLLSFPR